MAPRSLLLEELTWPEVREAIDSGCDTCLVISGSIEQHGPHLPLLTDTALGYEMGRRVAEKLGNALVAPVIRPGISGHHMDFAGSLTIPPELLVQLIEAYVANLVHHGFQRIVLLSSHGGNFATVAEAGAKLEKEYAGQADVFALADLWEFVGATHKALEPHGIDPNHAGAHAGLAETSRMMVIRPDLVLEDRLTRGYMGEVTDELFEKGLKHYSEYGVIGDANGSKVEYGELSFEAVASYLAEAIQAH